VISVKSGRIPTKTGKVFFFFFLKKKKKFHEPKLVGEDLLGREHGIGEEGLPDSDEFAGFQPVFQISPDSCKISPDSCKISPESLLRAF
jgi:hypothetical protein